MLPVQVSVSAPAILCDAKLVYGRRLSFKL